MSAILGFQQPPFMADDFSYLAAAHEGDGWPFTIRSRYWGRLPLWYVANWLHFQALRKVPWLPTYAIFFLIGGGGLLAIVEYLRRELSPSVAPRTMWICAIPFLLYPCCYEVLLWPTCMPYTIGLALLGAGYLMHPGWGRAALCGLAFLDSEMFVLPGLALAVVPMLARTDASRPQDARTPLAAWAGAVAIYCVGRIALTPPGLGYPFGWAEEWKTVVHQVALSIAGLFAIHFYDLAVIPTALCVVAAICIGVGLHLHGEFSWRKTAIWIGLLVMASGCHWVIRYPAVRSLYGAQMLLVAICIIVVARTMERAPWWACAAIAIVTTAFVAQQRHVVATKRYNEALVTVVEGRLVKQIAAAEPGEEVPLEKLDDGMKRAWTLHPDYWCSFARYIQLRHGLGDRTVRFRTVPDAAVVVP